MYIFRNYLCVSISLVVECQKMNFLLFFYNRIRINGEENNAQFCPIRRTFQRPLNAYDPATGPYYNPRKVTAIKKIPTVL